MIFDKQGKKVDVQMSQFEDGLFNLISLQSADMKMYFWMRTLLKLMNNILTMCSQGQDSWAACIWKQLADVKQS